MKYLVKYADMTPEDPERDKIIRGTMNGRCLICNCKTPFIDLYSEAYICSDECMKNFLGD